MPSYPPQNTRKNVSCVSRRTKRLRLPRVVAFDLRDAAQEPSSRSGKGVDELSGGLRDSACCLGRPPEGHFDERGSIRLVERVGQGDIGRGPCVRAAVVERAATQSREQRHVQVAAAAKLPKEL